MCRLLSLLLALSLPAVLLSADDAPKPNTLTPKEIADGWLLLFDGETTFGWHNPNDSKWTIADGMLAPQADKAGLLVTTTPFRDYVLDMEYQAKPDTNAELRIGCTKDGQGGGVQPLRNLIPIGSWTHVRLTVSNGYPVNATFRQGQIAPPARVFPQAKTGFDANWSYLALSGNQVVVRNIKLRPTELKPLFNGKDLTGWRKFEGNEKQAKSQFSVTPEGWLHIKNGPGDLQTEGQYADFLLQLECRTNGERLNSGVFFRCRPGEYQQGYEAQIHNGWADKAKDYVVEEYDPKTHELKEKKKVQSAAMDFGTGAIYRRIPARKAVAKDNEWFTMTVVAQGRHISTWVNGVQVVDWTDNRPLKDNARNGCRLEKGNISLQGHDPTTDLNFRNIRIVELAPEKKDK